MPSLVKPARWLFHSGTSASWVRIRWGRARSSKKTRMNSSLVRRKTKSSSPPSPSPAFEPLPAPPPPLRPLDAVTLDVFLIAGMHVFAVAALAMAEHGLGHVALGQRDVFALFEVADAAAADGASHRLADLLAIAPQETLAVADGLVLARQPAVDDLLQHGHGPNSFSSS